MHSQYDTQHLISIRKFSHDIHDLQKDMRILNAVRWPEDAARKFLNQKGRPTKSSIRVDYSETRESFSVSEKQRSIAKLRKRAVKLFETQNPDMLFIFNEMLNDLDNVSELLATVGTSRFGEVSASLYGSIERPLENTDLSILQIAERFGKNLERLSGEDSERMFPKILRAEGLAALLRQRLQEAHLIEAIKVKVVDDLVADAAAGSHYVKIRRDAKFSIKDVDVLLYHEIFTHIVTALNGRAQKYATWLKFDSPRCSSTQEGLAVFLEMFAGKTYPRRLRRIIDRILLLGQIQAGESPGHMYDSLREMRYSHHESLNLIMRALRGCDPESRQPFTKDISYLKGLVECFNFIQANLADSQADNIQALFCGKLQLKEVPALVRLTEAGVIQSPRWVPTHFLDVDSMVGWFAYVGALGMIRSPELQSAYRAQNGKRAAHTQEQGADTRPKSARHEGAIHAKGGATITKVKRTSAELRAESKTPSPQARRQTRSSGRSSRSLGDKAR